jgi:hypothetical protein
MLPRVRGRLLVVAAIALTALAACMAGTAPASGRLPTLLTEDFSTTFAVRPAQIVPTGDSSGIIGGPAPWIGRDPSPKTPRGQFGRIDWTSWTSSRATGVAVAWLDNGKPDEADGTYFPESVTVTATRVSGGRFTRLELTPRNGKPAGPPYVLKPAPNGYIWN